MKYFLAFTIVAICLIGCHRLNDDDYFNGDITIIKDIFNPIELQGEQLVWIDADGSNNGKLVVYDSLIIFFNPRLASAFFAIGDTKSKCNIGRFCLKGRGPLESTAIAPMTDVFEENNQLKTILFAPNENRFMIWNISQSILQKKTIFDTIIPLEERRERSSTFYNIYNLGSQKIITYITPGNNGYYQAASLPYYQIQTLCGNKLNKKFEIFINPIENRDVPDIQTQLFRSQDCIKPDKSKMAQSMSYLNQLNIIDLASGKVRGFRVENTPDFSIFVNKMAHANKYYCDSHADDDYIYSLYAGNPIFPEDGIFEQPQFLHVFSWDGQFVGKYNLGHKADYIGVDKNNGFLYTINERTEELYRYHLPDLKLDAVVNTH